MKQQASKNLLLHFFSAEQRMKNPVLYLKSFASEMLADILPAELIIQLRSKGYTVPVGEESVNAMEAEATGMLIYLFTDLLPLHGSTAYLQKMERLSLVIDAYFSSHPETVVLVCQHLYERISDILLTYVEDGKDE